MWVCLSGRRSRRRIVLTRLGVAGLASAAVLVSTPQAVADANHRRNGETRASGVSAGFVNDIAWSATSPARGVTVLSGSLEDAGAHPYWTVLVQGRAISPFTGALEFAEAGSSAWAAQTQADLQAHGFTPSASVLPWPDYLGVSRGVMGTRVRVGNFSTQAQAQQAASQVRAAGFAAVAEWTGFDPNPAPDAERVHVVIVDIKRFAGRVVADHGSAMASRRSAPDASAALGSLVSTNAGFFTVSSHFAQLAPVVGVNTGISAYYGKLESLANGNRSALILDGNRHARVDNLTTTATLRTERGSIRILGINRLPGSSEDCGVTGLAPTRQPRQDSLCTGISDLVLFTPEFGAPLPDAVAPATSADAIQVVLDDHHRVLTLGPLGTAAPLPAGQSGIQAIGTQADWIRANVRVGDRLRIDEQIRTTCGARVSLTPTTSIVSAGARLLRRGRTSIDAVDGGFLDPRDFNDYTFSAYRHARTMAGVDAHGRLILATADGVSGLSEGLTFTEEAELMRSLGAVDALNLDGGGSTEFAANGQLVGLVNDKSGTVRPDGGTLNVIPDASQ
jgi:hypothetical protein